MVASSEDVMTEDDTRRPLSASTAHTVRPGAGSSMLLMTIPLNSVKVSG